MNFDYNVEKQEITIELNTPSITLDTPTGGRGLQGIQGPRGKTGDTGPRGKDGYTPVKGVDYFTEEDIESLNIPTKVSDLSNDLNFIDNTIDNLTNYYTSTNTYTKTEIDTLVGNKQDTLVSGTNIKTINNTSLLGSGNINIQGGGGGSSTDVKINGTSITSNDEADIQTEGTYNATTNKIATMSDLPTVPTKLSDLTNDTGFITNTTNNLTNYYTKTNTYTKTEVDQLIGAISTLDIQIVQTLPSTGSTSTIYLVPKTASTNDNYDEYIYVNNNWEHIGSTEVDLSNYYTKTQTDDLLDDKADTSDIPTKVSDLNNDTGFITSSSLPTKVSDLTNDAGYITGYTETDPIYSASAASGIASSDITNWNNKADEGIQEITTSTVQVWNLDDGVYRVPSGKLIYYTPSKSFSAGTRTATLIINKSSSKKYFAYICGDFIRLGESDGTLSGNVCDVINSSNVKNNLTTSSDYTGYVLDARQGKVLKDLIDNMQSQVDTNTTDIGDLSHLETTDVTNLVSAINEVKGPEFDIDDILAITNTSDSLFIQLTDLLIGGQQFYISDGSGVNHHCKVIYGQEEVGPYGEELWFVYYDGDKFCAIYLITMINGRTVSVTKSSYSTTDAKINGTTVSNIITNTAYDSTTNKIATTSDINTVTGDLTTLTTTDKTDLVSAVNEVNAKDVISVGLTSNTNVSSNATWTHYTVPIDEVKTTIGNKLTFNSSTHRVIVGDGVSYVKVSVYTLLRGITSGIEFNVRKNGSGVVSLNVQPRTTSIFENSAAYLIVPASSGDYFDFTIRTGATGTITIAGGSSTAITFEAMN